MYSIARAQSHVLPGNHPRNHKQETDSNDVHNSNLLMTSQSIPLERNGNSIADWSSSVVLTIDQSDTTTGLLQLQGRNDETNNNPEWEQKLMERVRTFLNKNGRLKKFAHADFTIAELECLRKKSIAYRRLVEGKGTTNSEVIARVKPSGSSAALARYEELYICNKV